MTTRRDLCTLFAAGTLLSLVPVEAVRAQSVEAHLMTASLKPRAADDPPGFFLTAAWEFDLSRALVDCLRRGIPLYFLYEFEVKRRRWYWANKTIAEAHLIERLSFSPLTRTYRVSRGGLTQTFESLDAALPIVKDIVEWRVADLATLYEYDPEDLDARVRMRLDLTKLPKPLQVSIGGNSDWNLESDWESVPVPPMRSAS